MADAALIKQAIVDSARKQVGCHYLWGAAGNSPGQSDGPSYRSNYVQLHPNIPDLDSGSVNGTKGLNPNVPTLFAAWANNSAEGKLVCAGRCALEKEMAALSFALSGIVLKDALGLKLKDLSQAQVDELKKNSKDVAKFKWPRPKWASNRSDNPSTLWGESCVGVRHFDCIGLVNFCFSAVLKVPWQFGITSFTDPVHAKAAGFTQVTPISDAQTCDIVTIGSEHIGIVTNLQTAIEAMDIGNGVLERPLKAAGWTQCWRVPASTWN